MELSKNITDGISVAGDESVISDSVYGGILNNIFEIAAGKKGNEANFVECDQKIAYSSLLSLLLEATKHDAHGTTLSSLLEECQVGSQRITKFLNLYQENKEKIQLQLSLIGSSYDQIIDASWRQDYIIKSSNCEKISEPSYVISLKTWNTQRNSEDNITFGCSMEQLQDLVLKLKDATKCIERNAV